MRLAWPEKAALTLVAIELALIMLATIGNPYAFTSDWFISLGQFWRLVLPTALPLWVFLRVLDWVSGGPQRRAKVVIFPPLHQ